MELTPHLAPRRVNGAWLQPSRGATLQSHKRSTIRRRRDLAQGRIKQSIASIVWG